MFNAIEVDTKTQQRYKEPISPEEMLVLKLVLSNFESFASLLKKEGVGNEAEILKKHFFDIKGLQLNLANFQKIATLLKVEVLFHHLIKQRNSALIKLRASVKNLISNLLTISKKLQDSKWGRLGLVEVSPEAFNFTVNSKNFGDLTATEFLLVVRFSDRTPGKGFLPGDKEILRSILETGSEEEKFIAQLEFGTLQEYEYIEALNETNYSVYNLLTQLQKFFGAQLERKEFLEFYKSSPSRFCLLNNALQEQIQIGFHQMKVGDQSNQAYVDSQLDPNLEEGAIFLEKWESQLPALIELYQKIYEFAKKTMAGNRNRLELFKTYFKFDVGIFDPAFHKVPPSLEIPDDFRKFVELRFPERFQPIKASPQEKKSEVVAGSAQKRGPKKKKKASAAATAAPVSSLPANAPTKTWVEIASSSIEQKSDLHSVKHESTVVPKPVPWPYDSRVTRWFSDDIPAEYKNLSKSAQILQQAFHSFSPIVDEFILSYGIKTTWTNQTTSHQDLLLVIPGQMTFMESKANFKGVFVFCIGEDQHLYHRHFTPNVWVYDVQGITQAFEHINSLYQVGDSAEQLKLIPLKKNTGDTAFYHPLFQTIRIEDHRNKVEISLLWTPKSVSQTQ